MKFIYNEMYFKLPAILIAGFYIDFSAVFYIDFSPIIKIYTIATQ